MIDIIIPYDKDRGYLQEAIDSCGDFNVILSQSDNYLGYNVNWALEQCRQLNGATITPSQEA